MKDPWLLSPDTEHLSAHGVTYDLELIPFELGAHLRFLETDPIAVDAVQFSGNVAACRDTELPVTVPRCPVMSQRIYEALVEAGPMPKHRFIPAPTEAVPGGERRDDLGVLHLLEHADRFDFERSRFTRDDVEPDRIDDVTELAVLPFEDGLMPAVFRLSAFPYPLLVSDRARVALLESGARGCEFWELRRWM